MRRYNDNDGHYSANKLFFGIINTVILYKYLSLICLLSVISNDVKLSLTSLTINQVKLPHMVIKWFGTVRILPVNMINIALSFH